MLMVTAELLLLAAVAVFLVYYLFLLPPKYPDNIPTIPFWVALIPFFKDVDQSDIFRQYIDKPLRTHGAVKFFFAAQWNILVHRPSYIAEIFKDEDLYEKSGNQRKIPHSVLAQFLGDNIISSHGHVWKNYQSVIRPGLQRNNFEVDRLASNADKLCMLLGDAQLRRGKGRGVPVQEMLQQYSVANCSEVMLQTKFDALSTDAPINSLQSAVKREIFKPTFMNFPFLDRFPFPSRMRARNTVNTFRAALKEGLIASHDASSPKSSAPWPKEGLGRRMLDAHRYGLWDDKQLLDNLTVAFVAGQENPQLCMISTLYLLAKHPESQAKLHNELMSTGLPISSLAQNTEVLSNLPFLTSVILESLRLFPPIGQLINRRTSRDAFLGNGSIAIPSGTYVGYNCFSTGRDPVAWGPTADEFDPSRWGTDAASIQKQYRLRKSKAEFIAFHGGRRACLGEKFALLQMRVTVCKLVGSFTWGLDPAWDERMTPAGPFFPRNLKVVFEKRDSTSGK
ncbi:putative cytochrome P450 [Triangularia verruculosa]|uniref:Cytochrome P450 n=1 Tax=Triangularia verruculosa TaxID=2587418 RepID=A0AAN6X9E8_9PEZI|nr:putative cytochrome P450 [Triangularia verruculosa]